MRELEKNAENLLIRYKKDEENLHDAINDYKEVLKQQGENAPGILMCHYDIANQAFLKLLWNTVKSKRSLPLILNNFL